MIAPERIAAVIRDGKRGRGGPLLSQRRGFLYRVSEQPSPRQRSAVVAAHPDIHGGGKRAWVNINGGSPYCV